MSCKAINITELMNKIQVGDLIRYERNLLTVHEIHQMDNYWGEYIHADSYILPYKTDERACNITRYISEIFRREGSNYIRIAYKKNGEWIYYE